MSNHRHGGQLDLGEALLNFTDGKIISACVSVCV